MPRYISLISLILLVFFIVINAISQTTSYAIDSRTKEIEDKIDRENMDVRDTAVSLAANYPGDFNINQASDIYYALVEGGGWSYFPDPVGHEYYQSATESLQMGSDAGAKGVGDCEDFAILFASLIESLGGSARIIFAHDGLSNTGHAYPEIYLGEVGDPRIEDLKEFIKAEYDVDSIPGLSDDDGEMLTSEDNGGVWMSMDYNATYPGGPLIFNDSHYVRRVVAWSSALYSGKKVAPKVFPLIDTMNDISAWEIINDSLGSQISTSTIGAPSKNPEKPSRAINFSYDLKEGGFVGMARDVEPDDLAESEGINISYRMVGGKVILEMILVDKWGREFGFSRTLEGYRSGWSYLKWNYSEFKNTSEIGDGLQKQMLDKAMIKKLKLIVHDIEGDNPVKGGIALDTIEGIMHIDQASPFYKVIMQRKKALAIKLASDSRRTLNLYPYQEERCTLLAVESMQQYQTPEGYNALLGSLELDIPMVTVPHNASVEQVQFSPDSRYLATASYDNASKVLNLESKAVVAVVKHEGPVLDMQFCNDSKYLATASKDGSAKLLDLGSKAVVAVVEHEGSVREVQFSNDSKYLATAGDDGFAKVLDLESKEVVAAVEHEGSVMSVEFSPDCKYLASNDASKDGSARLLDLESKEVIATVEHNRSVLDTQFSPDSKYLATASIDHYVKVLDLEIKEVVAAVEHEGSVMSVEFSPNSKYLASVDVDSYYSIKVLDLESKETFTLLEHESHGPDKPSSFILQFSPSSKYMAAVITIDNICFMKIRDLESQEVATLEHEGYVRDVQFSPDSKYLAMASGDNYAKILDLDNMMEVAALGHEGYVSDVQFSPNGKYLATGSSDNSVKVLNLESMEVAATMKHETSPTSDTQSSLSRQLFSPDSKYLASAITVGRTSSVKVLNLESREVVATVEHEAYPTEAVTYAHQGDVPLPINFSLQFSPDSKYLATANTKRSNTAGYDYSTKVLELGGKEVIAKVKHEVPVGIVQFSPDNKYLATANTEGNDNTSKVLDLKSMKVVATLEHRDKVNDIQFSPDGRYLATGSNDNTSKVLNLESMEITTTEYEGNVNGVKFIPDSKFLAMVINDTSVKVLDLESNETVSIGGNEYYMDVQFSPDGKYLVTEGNNNSVNITDLKSNESVATVLHKGYVKQVDFSPDGKYLMITSSDDYYNSSTKVLDLESMRVVTTIEGSVRPQFSPDGKYLVTEGNNNSVNIMDLERKEIITTVENDGYVSFMEFSRDSKYLTIIIHYDDSRRDDVSIKVFELESMKLTAALDPEDHMEWGELSPDNKYLVTISSQDGSTKAMDLESMEVVATVKKEGRYVVGFVFSPDARYLVTPANDYSFKVLDLESMEVAATVEHDGYLQNLQFSPDGRYMLTRSNDRSVKILDLKSMEVVAILEHEDYQKDMQFSPDGKYLVKTDNNIITVLPFHSEDLIAEACSRLVNNLTQEEWDTYLPEESYQATCRRCANC